MGVLEKFCKKPNQFALYFARSTPKNRAKTHQKYGEDLILASFALNLIKSRFHSARSSKSSGTPDSDDNNIEHNMSKPHIVTREPKSELYG